MKASLPEIAIAIGAQGPLPPDRLIQGWSVDSRTIARGELFFALRGPRHDGHAFVSHAAERGALAAVVDRPLEAPLPLLRVSDTQRALESAAHWARSRFAGRVVAVTGSAGKTTTKDLIAALLAVELPVAKTEGNLNNHIGVPLTLLRLPESARAAVLELAMNHTGEIRHLASLARPHIGVVTNVGHAHAGFFRSIEEIALAKRELIESLPSDGIAVLNADDPRVAEFARVHPGRVITFGLAETAEIRGELLELGAERTRFRVAGVELETSLPGLHGVRNVLAALAVAHAFDLDPLRLRDAIRQFQPEGRRGRRFTHRGVTIFDDCYNSNPEALRAMLETLARTPAQRRIAVLGEMLELGPWSETLHREAGRTAVRCGVHVLVGIRGAAKFLVEAALEAGLPPGAAFFFEDPREAGRFLRDRLAPGDAVLFKGSRAVGVEAALEEVLADSPAEGAA